MTSTMLREEFQTVLAATSVEDFRGQLVRYAHQAGFEFVGGMLVIDHDGGRSDFINVDNMPEAYRNGAGCLASNYRRDPLMQHCKRSSLPIVWDQSTYVRDGAADLWEDQAAYGYRSGMAVTLHLPLGIHFMMGLDSNRDGQISDPELRARVADLQLYATHACETAQRLFGVHKPEHDPMCALSTREVEALKWTMEGKTAWEVGMLLNVAERTANKHLQNAMQKLDALTKHQAALKALRLGLLSL